MKYKPTIGLEIHAELKTNSKMFCSCKNDPEEKRPNFNVCPICMAHPGTLPVANKEAVRKVIKTGFALNCKVSQTSKFDRKNYFYPDLPKGYQISQYDMPLCKGGYIKMKGKKIKITRVHLEEDTGRLAHPNNADYSLVDFNRAGIPLMELVTEPDIESGKEASGFAKELQLVLRYLGVSDADMEKGQMRVEVNISLSPVKSQIQNPNDQSNPKSKIPKKLGTKVEIKNLNSFRTVEKAIDYEIKRQAEILDDKEKVIQETRGWNDAKSITFSQRKKEQAHDYRYFPEPDLPTLHFDKEFLNGIKAEIPELPEQKRKRFVKEYGLEEKYIAIFTEQKDLGEYFEKIVSELGERIEVKKLKLLIKLVSNYLITDVLGLVGGQFSEKLFKITPENFAEFINLINDGKITSKTAKDVLVEMAQAGKDPSQIIQDKGLGQINDEAEIGKAIGEAIKENSNAVNDYRSGKEAALQFLAGKIMAATRGKANPQTVQKMLKDILSK